MDMATAPDLTELQFRTATGAVGTVDLRLVSAAHAADAHFGREWDALAADPAEPNAFLERWFLLPSLTHLAGNRQINLKTFHVDGVLRGLLPVTRDWRYYGYPVPHAGLWLHANAFCGAPLVARGYERVFWRELLAHFDRKSRQALFLHLPMLPADGPMNAALDDVLTETGRNAFTVEREDRAMLSTQMDADAYVATSMTAKKRKELRRQRNRLSEEGALVVERRSTEEGIEDWISEFLALEASGWKGEAGSALASATDTRGFFTDTLIASAQSGRLERLALRLDGRAIAMLASFITPPGVFSFKTTFDEAYARYSPGLLLQLENLELLSRPAIQWADSCAVEGHSMIERIWREKRRLVSRNVAIGGALRRAAFGALMAYETRGQTPL